MSKLPLACVLALALTGAYSSAALAAKVVRDPTKPMTATPPPRAANPAPVPANLPKLTAAQIVEKNVAARGGATAWRAVQSMSITGKLDAGGKKDTLLPYTLQVERPNKERLAIEFAGHTGLQVFDGEHGWKLRPWLNRPDPEPFSPEELAQAKEKVGLEGALIDYAAKGSQVVLDGTEMVEGKGTYRLKLTSRDGREQRIWIDGSTFLETKIEGDRRRFDGQMRRIETYLRDYRRVEGLTIPFVSETRVERVAGGHAMTIEKVVLNPKIDDSAFAKPASLTAAELPPLPRMVKLGAATEAAPAPPPHSTAGAQH
jgi:outer membrane lipoprotein-sorting protein